MDMDMDIWQELRQAAESHPSHTVETTLLGGVSYKCDADGTTTSIIPRWIAKGAERHGLRVIDADWKRDTYKFQMEPT